MTGYSIFLTAVGLFIVFLSYMVSEKVTGQEENIDRESIQKKIEEEWTAKIDEKFNEIMDEKAEDKLDQIEESLSRLSNEKIMAVGEYSDQVIEKINENHKEVVFLYDMLNNKKEELQKFMSKLEEEKRVTEQILMRYRKEIQEKNVEVRKQNKPVEEPAEVKKQLKPAEKKKQESFNEPVNSNDQILKLYREGKSVLEIAKTLGLGQGEVKLVVDLFQEVEK